MSKPARELAALAGVSESTLDKHVAEGAPTPKSARALQDWLRAYHAWRMTHGKVQVRAAAPASENDPATLAARREKSKREAALLDMRLSREMGDLIPRSGVIGHFARAVHAVRLRLDMACRKMSSRLANSTSDVIAEELRREFGALCDDFAQGLSRASERDEAA